MIIKPSSILVLLSSLTYHYVSGAIVSLPVLDANPEQALTGQFLGTDDQGHTSWSIGPGSPSDSFTDTAFPAVTLIAGDTDAQEFGVIQTEFGGATLSVTASESCAFATPTGDGVFSGICSGVGEVIGFAGGATTTSTVTTAYTTMATLVPVQLPDSGESGSIPNGAKKGDVSWAVVGPASLLVIIAAFM